MFLKNNLDDSIVCIRTQDKEPVGTGCIVGRKGLQSFVLTAAHVAKNAGQRSIVNDCKVVSCKAGNNADDFAILSVQGLTDYPFLKLGRSPHSSCQTVDIAFIDTENMDSGHQARWAGVGSIFHCKANLIKRVVLQGPIGKPGVCGWEFCLSESEQLKDGQSGSPIFVEAGKVSGIVIQRKRKSQEGLLIPIERVASLFPQLLKQLDYEPVDLKAKTIVDWPSRALKYINCREQQLATLKEWVDQQEQLIVVSGEMGMGKSVLCGQLVDDLEQEYAFDFILGCSVEEKRSLEDVMQYFIERITKGKEAIPEAGFDRLLEQLIDLLQKYRCLLLLDDVEEILGKFTLTHTNAQENKLNHLMRCVKASSHGSCLILISEIELPKGSARECRLVGLDKNDVKSWFAEKLNSKEMDKIRDKEWQDLIAQSGGNPKTLGSVAERVSLLFNGDLGAYIRFGMLDISADFRKMREEEFERLHQPNYKDILYWMAINGEPISHEELAKDIKAEEEHSQIFAELASLMSMKWLAGDINKLSLNQSDIEVIRKTFKKAIFNEIINDDLNLLKSHALVKAQAKDSIRSVQSKEFVEPLVVRLRQAPYNKIRPIDRMKGILDRLKDKPFDSRYAPGNIVNLLNGFGEDLRFVDITYLPVWQADFSQLTARGVNFMGCDLSGSVFMEKIGPVNCVASSPDSKLIATGESTGDVSIWEAEPIVRRRVLSAGVKKKAHLHSVWSVAFSADGRTLASGSYDGSIAFWDIVDGTCVWREEYAHKDGVNSVAFGSSPEMFASGGNDNKVLFWRMQAKNINWTAREEHENTVHAVRFSPSGQMLASTDKDGTIILWNADNGEVLNKLKADSGPLYALAFSPDSSTLASGGESKSIFLWDISDVAAPKQAGRLLGHLDIVSSLAFVNNTTLASACHDKSIILWDIHGGQKYHLPHTDPVHSLCLLKDNHRLVTGSSDSALRLFDITDTSAPRSIKTIKGYASWVNGVAFNNDDRFVSVACRDRTLRLWDIESRECDESGKKDFEREVSSVAFSPDGLLATGSHDGSVKLWQLSLDGKLMLKYKLADHKRIVHAVCFSYSGKLFASLSADNTARLWCDLTSSKYSELPGDVDELVGAIAFSPCERYIASTGKSAEQPHNYCVRLWDADTSELVHTHHAHEEPIQSLVFCHDHHRLILATSCSGDPTIMIWDLEDIKDWKCIGRFEGPGDAWARSLVFHPTKQNILISGNYDGSVKLLDITSGKCDVFRERHSGHVFSVAVSNDGDIVASGGDDECVFLWDFEKRELTSRLPNPKPYDGMNITRVTGLSEAQEATLLKLGAISETNASP